jgi:hypothetical protein
VRNYWLDRKAARDKTKDETFPLITDPAELAGFFMKGKHQFLKTLPKVMASPKPRTTKGGIILP